MARPRSRHDGPGGRPAGPRRLRAHAVVLVTVSALALGTAALAAQSVEDFPAGGRAEAANPDAGPTSPSPGPGGTDPGRAPTDATSPATPSRQATTAPSTLATSTPSTAPVPESTQHSTPPASPSPPAGPPPNPEQPDPVTAAVAQAEQVAATFPSMQLGIAVVDLSTGHRVDGALAGQPFYAASLTKLIVAIDILTRRESANLPVTAADRALLSEALGPSNDSAMNALWVTFDGPGAVQRVTAKLGLTGTALPTDSSQWGEVTVSARDMAILCAFMMSELSPSDRAFLVDVMQAAPNSAADGFDQSFGLLSPSVRADQGTDPIAKQGWLALMGGILHLNSVGVVGGDTGYAVALLSRQTVGGDWDRARQQLTAVSDNLAAALS